MENENKNLSQTNNSEKENDINQQNANQEIVNQNNNEGTKAEQQLKESELKKIEKQQAKEKKQEEKRLKAEQKLAEKEKIKEQKLQQRLDRANRNVLWLWFLSLLLLAIVLLYIWDTSRKMHFMKNQQKRIDTLVNSNHFYRTKYLERDSMANKLLSDYNKILSENITKSTTLEKQKQELLNLQKIIYKQDSIMQSIKKTIEQALTGYPSDQITVKMINGKLYVTLREKLLFASGSAQVSQNGTIALSKIAKVLKNNTEIQITIEGHTDNVPINPKNKQFKDNWDLSTARAVEVTKILIEKYGVRPELITAAGKSMYFPVAPNTTEAGKAQNRRIEFIISPNLSELYKLIDDSKTTK